MENAKEENGWNECMKEYPPVDLVVVNYNSGDILSKSLRTLIATEYPALSIIVVDNGSSDESSRFIKEDPSFAHVILVENDQNRGWAAGCNSAAPHFSGKYCAFLNEDLFALKSNWLKKLVTVLEENPDIGAVSPMLVNRQGRYEYLTTYFSRSYCIASSTSDRDPSLTSCGGIWDVPFAGVLLTRTRLYRRVGGFREKYFLYWEDFDYCTRIWANHERVSMTSTAVLGHIHQGSVKRNLSRFRLAFIISRNSLLFFFIFYPLRDALRFLLKVLLFRCCWFVGSLLNGHSAEAAAILAGMVGSLANMTWAVREREFVHLAYAVGPIMERISLLTPDPWKRGLLAHFTD